MQKIDHPVLDRLIDTVGEIHATQHRLAELKERLQEEARVIRDVDSGKTRFDIAAYAYWYLPEVHAEELVLAVTKRRNIHHFLDLVGPVISDLSCDECGKSLRVTSRTDMKSLLAYHQKWSSRPGLRMTLCGRCGEVELARWKVESAKKERERQNRYAELRAMPYEEYRRTLDWRHQREKYFELLRHAHGMNTPQICEVCNSSAQELDVYHKALDRLGHENLSDLILLCPNCHDLLYRCGRLAA